MSFNFTGSTSRRRVNLGGRAANGGAFLQGLKQDRLLRDRTRTQAAMATIIQKHIRGAISREETYNSLSLNWTNTKDIHTWHLFFPNLISTQPINQSLSQLGIISNCYLTLSFIDKQIVLKTLIAAIRHLPPLPNNTSNDLLNSILSIFELDFRSNENLLPHIQMDTDPLVNLLISSFLNSNLLSILKFIPYISSTASFSSLLPLILSKSKDVVFSQISNNNLNVEFVSLILDKLQQVDINTLNLDEKLSILNFISNLSLGIPAQSIFNNNLRINSLALLLISIPNVKYLADIQELTKFFCDPGFYKSLLGITNLETFNSLTYSLFKFSSNALESNDSQTFQTNLTITLITIKGNFIFNAESLIFESLPAITSYDELISSLFQSTVPQFWVSIFVLNEILFNILNISSDIQFFQRSKLSLDQFKQYTSFIKKILVLVILDYDNNNNDLKLKTKMELQFFHDILKSSTKILNSIHLRNYQMKIFPNEFWNLKFKPTQDSIEKACKIITDLNEDSDYLNDEYPNESFNLSSSISKNYSKNLTTFIYILNYIPFMIPFEYRANLFHKFIDLDKSDNPFGFRSSIEGIINRGNIFIESFKEFGNLSGNDFKKPLSVQFTNEFGEREAGIDGGGLTKELLTSLIESILPTNENRKRNLNLQFFEIGENGLYPNNEMFFKYKFNKFNNGIELNDEYKNYLNMIKFIGMVIGKCIYENVLIDISFTNFFLRRWLQSNNINKYSFQDLMEIDINFYKNLNDLLKIDNEKTMEDLSLTFSITDKFILNEVNNDDDVDDHHNNNNNNNNNNNLISKYVEIDLIPNGSNIPVTINNKFQFILILTKFKLEIQNSKYLMAFMEGFNSIIKPYQLKFFDSFELQRLISGGEIEININDLFNNIEFGGFLPTDKTIKYLYEILCEFDNESRGKFLKFVTSCPKPPLLGFKELNPKFGIRNAGRSDLIRLPTASTCVNLLKIPDYQDKKILKTKLIKSINSKSGFDLS